MGVKNNSLFERENRIIEKHIKINQQQSQEKTTTTTREVRQIIKKSRYF